MLTKAFFAAALAAIGISAFGFDPPAYDATYTEQGVTYAQRGGLGMKDFVVTNIVVNGQPRPLPPYLYLLELDDTYPDDAEWYYQQIRNADGGHCSVRRNGNAVERNYDWHFDDAATFVLKVSGVEGRRFASVGVANVGTNLTDSFVRSGAWSRYYKCLAGHTMDGINENGLVAEVNVTSGSWGRTSGAVHGSGAVRWALDHGTNAQQAAEFLAANVYLPQDFGLNLHYLIADKTKTYIVENCEAHEVTNAPAVMTNFSLDRQGGEGYERYASLTNGETIESQWWTLAYNPATRPVRSSDLGGEAAQIWAAWNDGRTKEQHRGESFGGVTWWQTVHCSKYDIPTLTLRIAVQEIPDWYVFAVPSAGGKVDAYTKAEVDERLTGIDETLRDTTRIAVNAEDLAEQALETKADRPANPVAGNLAALDENGNLDDSGIAKDDVVKKQDGGIDVDWVTADAITIRGGADLETIGELAAQANITAQGAAEEAIEAKEMIHHTNETFSNEVAEVASTIKHGNSLILTNNSVMTYSGIVVNDSETVFGLRSMTNKYEYVFVEGGSSGFVYACDERPSLAIAVTSELGQPTYYPDSDYWSWPGKVDYSVNGCSYLDNGRPSSADAQTIRFIFMDNNTYDIYHVVATRGITPPHIEKTGRVFATESANALRTMLVDANTNQTADCECISTNICKLAAPAITNAVINTRDRFYDAELDVTWKRTVSGGRIFYDIEAVGDSTED